MKYLADITTPLSLYFLPVEQQLPNYAHETSIVSSNKSSAVAEMGDRGHNRHGPKRGGAVVPLLWRAETPSNTMWPEPRSTSVQSGAFIHSAFWPQ